MSLPQKLSQLLEAAINAQKEKYSLIFGNYFELKEGKISGACPLGMLFLENFRETETLEVLSGTRSVNPQGIILTKLQKKILSEYQATDLLTLLDGFDDDGVIWDSEYYVVGQELRRKFLEKKDEQIQ